MYAIELNTLFRCSINTKLQRVENNCNIPQTLFGFADRLYTEQTLSYIIVAAVVNLPSLPDYKVGVY